MHNQMISTCILRNINPPHSIFSISLPCQLPNPFPVSYYKFRMHAESDTKSARNICPSSTNVLVPPTPFSKDQWLCTCGVRTARAMFSLLVSTNQNTWILSCKQWALSFCEWETRRRCNACLASGAAPKAVWSYKPWYKGGIIFIMIEMFVLPPLVF